MINGNREVQCHQHKTMIYSDKENSFISIKKMKLFEELKLTREGADPEFAASSVDLCYIHVCPWFVLLKQRCDRDLQISVSPTGVIKPI